MRVSILHWVILAVGTVGARAESQVLTLSREVRIDGVVENLVTPRWILVGRDGRMVVSQQSDRSLRVFDASGKPIGTFGRSGQGPGEFQSLLYGGWIGDSVWVSDILNRRATVATPGLALARVFSDIAVKPPADQASRFPSSPTSTLRAVYSDGTALVDVSAFSGIPAGFDTSGSRLFLVAGDGVIRRQVAHINIPSGAVNVRTADGFFATFKTPFYADPLFKVSDRGSRIASLRCVYEGQQANTMRIVVLGKAGDTVYARNYPFTPEMVPRRVADSVLADRIERSGQSGSSFGAELAAAMSSAVRERMRIPPFYSPFTDMLMADDGTAWIGLRSPPGGADAFMVLDPRGNVVGTVGMPARTRPLAVSSTHMWGVELDQDDVPSIVRYRVSQGR